MRESPYINFFSPEKQFLLKATSRKAGINGLAIKDSTFSLAYRLAPHLPSLVGSFVALRRKIHSSAQGMRRRDLVTS